MHGLLKISNYISDLIKYAMLLQFIGLLSACAPQPPVPSPGHLNTTQISVPKKGDIPPLVQNSAYVPPPHPIVLLETYSVSVVDVPVNELLFALARDAGLNIDIHPGINRDKVTINAINQTLPQILASSHVYVTRWKVIPCTFLQIYRIFIRIR